MYRQRDRITKKANVPWMGPTLKTRGQLVGPCVEEPTKGIAFDVL